MIEIHEETDDGLILRTDSGTYAVPVEYKDQIVCFSGKSVEDAQAAAESFLESNASLKSQAEDLLGKAEACETAGYLERADQYRARARRLCPEICE